MVIGIVIDKQFQGHEYSFNAMGLLIDFLFNRLNLNRIQLDTWSENKIAIKLYEKLNFKLEGILKENDYYNGKYGDTLI